MLEFLVSGKVNAALAEMNACHQVGLTSAMDWQINKQLTSKRQSCKPASMQHRRWDYFQCWLSE